MGARQYTDKKVKIVFENAMCQQNGPSSFNIHNPIPRWTIVMNNACKWHWYYSWFDIEWEANTIWNLIVWESAIWDRI